MSFFYIIFTYITFGYQAYADGNSPMVVFIAFLTICELGVVICKQQLDGLSRMDTSLRKHFLKSAVWFFQSAIFFGSAYLFYTFVHPVAAVFMFAIAVCASYFLYVLLYIVPHGHGHPQAPETPTAGPLNGMTAKLTDVEFVKLDVDELPDVAQEFGVQAMPTFALLRKGKEVDRMVGAQK
ncbi:hypothetical protein V6N13_085893 [Hibiscus sabdariffa]|uniref:Thioredoxin domain-containing protein n=1 Tax=Hibiscus sabdariffa TaxID=183260 RepID=A0ABR2FS09_9ROSI